MAVYQNGVRVNEVFGDIVNWDFIPETAINRMTLMPSNPVYGLNALGGALSIDMKNGFTYQGTETELRGGSFGRRAASVQTGGQAGNLSGYLTADAINDNGWRDYSPSQLRRIYADLGARGDQTEFHVTFTGASNNFGAAAATPIELLNRNWASVYTLPQTTQNQLAFLTASASWNPIDTLSLQGNVYYRGFWQRHVDGNGTAAQNSGLPRSELSVLSRSQGNLTNLIGLNGLPVPATGRAGQQRPGRDRPHLDRGQQLRRLPPGGDQRQDLRTRQSICRRRKPRQRPTSSSTPSASSEPSMPISGHSCRAWASISISLPGTSRRWACSQRRFTPASYATDTFDVTSRLSITFGGRFNVAQIGLRDTLGNNDGLNGDHRYSRFNPVIGATFKITPNVTAYGGYAEANRAPTPLELGCADPMRPCLLDNALVGDPPLKQVVSHTYEAGLRGQLWQRRASRACSTGTWAYSVREHADDIINVASPLPGHQYFQNGGDTLRRGIEAGAVVSMGPLERIRELHLRRRHLPQPADIVLPEQSICRCQRTTSS